jgi:hypothetical protein
MTWRERCIGLVLAIGAGQVGLAALVIVVTSFWSFPPWLWDAVGARHGLGLLWWLVNPLGFAADDASHTGPCAYVDADGTPWNCVGDAVLGYPTDFMIPFIIGMFVWLHWDKRCREREQAKELERIYAEAEKENSF